MMKYHLHSKQLLLIFTFLLLIVACQEDPVNEEMDLADEDMIAATKLAEDYLNSPRGHHNTETSITVLKFIDGKLFYDTNTDYYWGYREVTEETVTAYVEPGEHVFWYSGGGVSDLDGIEFDAASQQQLDDSPEEINEDMMWVIMIPENIGNNVDLKYDIIYQFNGNNGPPIRLDPKIKVQG